MDREQVRMIVSEIRSYHTASQFVRSGGGFQLLVPGGPTPEQILLVSTYRSEIYEYLCTPPAAQGQCWRGHEIKWVCTSGGTWLCICFYWTPERVNWQTAKEMINTRTLNTKYRDYWTKESQAPAPRS